MKNIFTKTLPLVVMTFLLAARVMAQAPTIASFTPASGPVGTSVTITGANFNTTAANNIVFFGATMATVTAASATSLTVTVPAGATYQPISVLNGATALTAYSAMPFATTFTPTKGSITTADISAKVDFTTGSTPESIAIGDLDGDGKPDLVVANSGSNTISVYRNISANGSITTASFAAKVDFTTGNIPVSVAIGDLDGDGKPDLAVSNINDNTISVFRNTSSSGSITAASFAAKVDFATGSGPTGVAIGDLDGDGKPELVTVNGNNTVSVLRNTTSSGAITPASFAANADFATGGGPFSIAIGDLDGDGKPDLAVANKVDNTVSVLRNTSTSGSITAASFATKIDFATGISPRSVAIGDLDGDGKPDLAVTNNTSNTVSVFRNTSTIGSITATSFDAKVDFATGSGPFSLVIGDLDGDGKPDLAVANVGGSTVSVFRNTSSSGSITTTSFAAKVDFATGNNPHSLAIGDLDGDGKPDLAVASASGNTVSVLRNSPVFPPPTITSFTPASGPVGTSVTITGTNFNTTATNNIVFFGATMATVTAASATSLTVTVPAGATYQPISVLNGATSLIGYSAAPFATTFTPAKGSITTADISAKVDFAAGTTPYSIAIGDLDGDGKPDLAVANEGSNTVSVYRNTSASGSITAASFAAKVDFATSNGPSGVAIGDLDGDGKPDLAVANQAGTVSVLRNTSSVGSINFAAKVDFAAGSTPIGIAIGDLDGDGKPDLAVTNEFGNTVSIFRNTSTSGSISTASFAAKVDFATGSGPYSIAIGDLDGDGKPDLAVANRGDNTVSVLRNAGTSGSITSGSFAAKVDFATGTSPESVAIGDLDGDGKPDLAVANNSSSTISVYRNTSTIGFITTASFAAKVDFATGTNPAGIAIGDLDGDGKLDLAVANITNNTISVFRNTSSSGSITSASFVAKVDFITGNSPRSVAIGDLDGDGKPDLAVVDNSAATVSILRNNPVYPPTITSFTPASGPVGTSVTITGTNFNATTTNNIVFFGATMATVTAASATSLTVTVPTGATYQPISVLNGATALTGYSAAPFATTFTPTKGSITTADIAAKVDFTTGSAPASVAIGDLDGDGKPDLVVVNTGSSTISVYRNISSSGSITAASFAAKIDFATGSSPRSVAIGDLDGDGKPDLVVINGSDNTVSVLRNTSSSGSITAASFAAKVDFATGSAPQRVAIGDLDGDGKPDLAVVNTFDNTVSVYRNTSSSGSITAASFAAKVDFATGSSPFSIAIGDLDGDGKPDLAVVNDGSGTVSIFRNTSTGGAITTASFAAKVDFITGANPFSVAIGDLDGDGKPDLAVGNSASGTISVFRNTSASGSITAASFAAKVDFAIGGASFSIAIGDLDGDGKPDLASANGGSNTVSILRNTSVSGSITAASFAATVNLSTFSRAEGMALGDLDGDGRPDLAVVNETGNTVSILRDNPVFPPPTITSFTPSSGPVGTSVTITGTNFNTTTTNNIVFFGATMATVTAASATSLTVTVPAGATYQPISVLNGPVALTGYSAAPFATTFTPTKGSITTADIAAKVDFTAGTQPSGVAIGDLDGDGKPDLVVANLHSATVSVYFNTSASGSITAGSFAAKVDFATGTGPASVAIGDLDGDGKPDLVVANEGATTVSVLRNTSTSGSITAASFAAKVDFSVGTSPESVAIGDLDGDGKPDLVTTNQFSGTVSVLRNTSASGSITPGSFAANVDFVTGSGPQSVAIGDLDGDGKPDLAVANFGSNTVSILRNISASGSITSGSFAAKVDVATGFSPLGVAIGDLDGDGKPDLAVANEGSATVSVFRNISTSGSFTIASLAAKVDFATGASPTSIAIGDLDGDGKPDLAIGNQQGNTISVLRNTSVSGSITAASFAAKVDLATGTNPKSVVIGDLDGDGRPDLAVANLGSGTISLFRNNPLIAPTTQATNVIFTNTTTTATTASWTNGDGASRAVFMLAGNTGSPAPVDLTAYTANAAFASGDQVATTGWYCVYNGTGTTVNITGLTLATTYRVMTVEYNGSGSSVAYLTTTATGNPANVTTISPPTITSFTPASGPVGTSVTVTGTNFNATAANNIVFFGATMATVTAASTTSLTVTVPAGATYQPISVLNGATSLIGYSATPFITTFTPTKGNITTADIAAKVDFATGSGPQSVAIGDLDGDGKPDLVVANSIDNTISVYRNTSSSGSITAASFAAKVDFATGDLPRSVAIGDLDGDGKPDLVVANGGDNTVSVLRNTSSSGSITAASFAAKVDFATGSAPQRLAIGDLDGDGKPDLAVANEFDNTVSVLRNTSASGSITTASFAAKVDFATGSFPISVAIGDLDGDGKPDLAVVNSSSNTVSVLRNTSSSGSITSGSFAAKVDFATGGSPVSVAIGDLDGDGKPDLAVANGSANTVSVLRNTSTSGSITTASFAAKADFATGSFPISVAISDLDGDGKPDLAVANNVSNTVSVLRNTATSGAITAASFAAKVDFATGSSPQSVAVGDLDGDGRPDLAVVNQSSATVSVLRNNPVFPPPTITSFTPASGPVGTSVTLTGTSFNTTTTNNIVFFGATMATITAASATSLTVTVPAGATYQPISVLNGPVALTGYSASPFATTFTPTKGSITTADISAKVDFATGTGPWSVAIGDLDGDGKPDLAVVNFIDNTVSIYRNTSASGSIAAASFAAKVNFATGSNPRSVSIVDLDGDGKPDLVVANEGSATVSVFRNTSASGSITAASFAAKVDFATGTSPTSVAIGDLDGDGKPDLAVANSADNTVSVLRNTSTSGSITTASFAAKVDFTTGTDPQSVSLGDLDGDGKPDLAVANANSGTVSVFRNTSASGSITSASFAAKVDFATGSIPISVAIGDLDGDGKPDLGVINQSSNTVSIFRNTSASGSITSGSFAAKVDFATGTTPAGVAIGDLDGDGKPDLAVVNESSNTVSIFRNTSASGSITTASFAAKVDFVTGITPISVMIGDLDGDGKPDLAVANLNGNKVSILRDNPLIAPTTQATNVIFTNTTTTATTASWTNGNGAARAVFMLAGATGSPGPIDLTAYTANAAFASGDQIATTGWYCVYNGTGTTVNITGLTPATTYRVMTVEYNGTGSSVAYLTTTATENPSDVTTLGPVVAATGTISVVNTIYGTASATPATFSVGGTNLTANLVVTPPAGFEVSSTSATSGYASTVTLVPSAGTVATTTIYLRLSATTAVGTYGNSGNAVLTSTGATTVNIPTVSSTVSPAGLTILASGVTKTYGTAISGFSGSTAYSITSGTLMNGNTISSVSIAYGTGALATDAAATYTGSVTPSAAAGANGFVSSNYDITYTAGDLVVQKANLTITATGPPKTYGTALTAGISATNFTAGVPVNGETVTSVTLTPDAAGLSATTAAGASYTITAGLATGSGGFLESNYNVTYIPFTGTVGQAALTVTATGPAKTYGTALTAGTSATNFTAGATVNSETVTSVTLTPDAAGLSATTAAGASYTVTPGSATGSGGFLESNYNVTYIPFTGTVGQAALTVTATGPAKTYGVALTTGTSSTNFTVTGTPASGEALTSVTLTPDAAGLSATTSAGSSYTVTPSAATGSGGFLAANYTITYVPFGGTVAQANLTISANDINKIPGTTLTGGPGSAAFTTIGLQNSETVGTVTIAYGTGSAAGDAPGTYTGQVTPSAATGGTFIAGNYAITYASGNIIVGTSAINTAGTLSAISTTYGTASANTSFSVSGSNLSNDITVTAPTGFEVSASPGNGFGSSITLTQSGGLLSSTTVFVRLSATTAANNYSGNVILTSTGAATVNAATVNSTVSPAALTITANNATKVYGAVNPALNVTYSGFVNGDTHTSLTTQPNVATTAGTGSPVGTYPVTASAAVSPNYTISYTAGTLTVTPAALTIAASDATKVYGGVNPTMAATYNGFVNGDTNTSLTTQPTVATTAGTGSPVGTYLVTASAAVSPNYTISYTAGTLTVTPAALTIAASDATKVYGAVNPALDVTYNGFVNGDTNTSLTTQPTLATTAVTGSPVSTYPVTAGSAVSANYTISYTAGTLTVTPAALIIAASNAIKVYGTVNPALDVTYTGFVNGDSAASLTSPATAATTATANSPAGTYPITASGAASNNYTFNYANGTLTILSAARTLTFSSLTTKTYGDTDFDPGATASSGETVIYTSSNTAAATIVNGKIHITGAGTTTITASLPANSNYTNSLTSNQVLVIDKASQTISFASIPLQLRGGSYDLSSVTATSGLPVSFSSSDPLIAGIQAQTLNASRLGTATITASQAGNSDFLPAGNLEQLVTVADAAGDEVLVHPAVSPNGDGINDFLYIEGIQNHLNNRVTLIDRNGVKIFEISGYDNASHVFDGHSNITGALQQQGTYFYLIEYTVNGEGRRKTGYFVLKY